MNTSGDLLTYSADCGQSHIFISVNGQPAKKWTQEQFLDLKWFEGPGYFVSENSTFAPKPVDGVPSKSQYFTYDQWMSLIEECKDLGISFWMIPCKRTQTFVQFVKELRASNSPLLDGYDGIDFTKIKRGLGFTQKDKNDSMEAATIGFIFWHYPEIVQPVYIKDPDATKKNRAIIKNELIESANKDLNRCRNSESLDHPRFHQFNQATLEALDAYFKKEIENGNPFARELEELEYIPLERYKSGEIKPITKGLIPNIFAHMVDENGKRNPAGFRMVSACFGFNGFRFKSGIAGGYIHTNFFKQSLVRKYCKAHGIPEPSGNELATQDRNSPFYSMRKHCMKLTKEYSRIVYKGLNLVLK